MRPLEVQVVARDGAARATTVDTARGRFHTPCFMPVGTRGAVRHLSSVDLGPLGVEVMLANTYHLMLRPGAEIVAGAGGLHRFMAWDGHVLTDSGGYQVYSLAPRIDDEGVLFRSTYDGSTHLLTPEGAVTTQEALGADIAMVLDECPALPAEPAVIRAAVDRTAAWAERSRAVHRRTDQSLFGIVQGGVDPAARRDSACRTVALDFDGYGIGGLSVGEPRPQLLEALEATVTELPDRRLRYLMGVGDPVGIVEAVARGVDLFDCVLPTRLARHGTVLTRQGRLNLRNARFARDDDPLDPDGPEVVRRWSRAYLRHLLLVGEPTAARLLTLHNLAWLLDLVARARQAILCAELDGLRSEVAEAWGGYSPAGRAD